MSEKQPQVELGYVRMPKRLQSFGEKNPLALQVIGTGLMQLMEIEKMLAKTNKIKSAIISALSSEKVLETAIQDGTKEEYLEFLAEALKATEEGHTAKFQLSEEELQEVMKNDKTGGTFTEVL